jgi:rSAM/selenodomain-associated transferase 1
MAIARATPEAAVAVLAKAPIPGYAKTRLVPRLGAEGAARLQERLIDRALATAAAAAVGRVTLWCAPDAEHPFLKGAARHHRAALSVQPDADLGERMLAAFRASRPGEALVLIGTDCPVLTPVDLSAAVAGLSDADAVIAPAEDGGYGLIAARRPIPDLFSEIPWGTDLVAARTRERARACGLHLFEIRTVWDVDRPSDVERLRAAGIVDLGDLGGVLGRMRHNPTS